MTVLTRCIAAAGTAVFFGLAATPAAFAAPLPMVIQADTVLSGECVLSNQFKHNDAIVWRARVLDTKTGESMGPDQLTSLVAELPDGTSLPLHFGDHPPEQPAESYWTVSWLVPEDYPTGTFTYKIVATDPAGETVTFEPFKVPPSQLTILAD